MISGLLYKSSKQQRAHTHILYIYVHMHIEIHSSHIHTRTHTHAHAHVHAHAQAHARARAHARGHARAPRRAQARKHANTQTHKHTDTSTHKDSSSIHFRYWCFFMRPGLICAAPGLSKVLASSLADVVSIERLQRDSAARWDVMGRPLIRSDYIHPFSGHSVRKS